MDLREEIGRIDALTHARYRWYLESIRPISTTDMFRRWVFAFMSVHTNWTNNVSGYLALRDLAWLGNDEELLIRLSTCGAGFHNNRKRYLSKFAEDFWTNPEHYTTCTRVRRRQLVGEVLGLGLAKVTFAMEMLDPTADLVCLDRHVLKWLTGGHHDLNGKMSVTRYEQLEDEFLGVCDQHGFRGSAVRHILWDRQQNQQDMRYWSYVLEDNDGGGDTLEGRRDTGVGIHLLHGQQRAAG